MAALSVREILRSLLLRALIPKKIMYDCTGNLMGFLEI